MTVQGPVKEQQPDGMSDRGALSLLPRPTPSNEAPRAGPTNSTAGRLELLTRGKSGRKPFRTDVSGNDKVWSLVPVS